jgi:hypothetical protein
MIGGSGAPAAIVTDCGAICVIVSPPLPAGGERYRDRRLRQRIPPGDGVGGRVNPGGLFGHRAVPHHGADRQARRAARLGFQADREPVADAERPARRLRSRHRQPLDARGRLADRERPLCCASLPAPSRTVTRTTFRPAGRSAAGRNEKNASVIVACAVDIPVVHDDAGAGRSIPLPASA